MAENRPELELLFFDTFSHENAEELNLDLVQFPRPVIIGEVRVIPLQTRVQADVPGGVRLGATNPSRFELECFVNNLSKPNASTFEKLGLLDYKANDEIQLLADVQIPTDGLILKGFYNTLTIAIYGVLTNINIEPESLPPPPPPQPRKHAPTVQPQSQSPVTTASMQLSPVIRDHRVEQKELEPSPQAIVVAPPHTTMHPLDYIQQQLQQANLQPPPITVTSVIQPHPMVMVSQPIPVTGQIPMGIPPPMTDFIRPEDYGRHPGDSEIFSSGARPPGADVGMHKDPYDSREPWAYLDRDPRREQLLNDGREFPSSSSRDSRERDREGRDYRDGRGFRDDRDWERDGRGNRERSDYDRDAKDRGRGFDQRRDRDFDQDRERAYDREQDGNRTREYEYDRGRDGAGDRDGYRDQERARERDSDMDLDRAREWEGDRGREREADRNRDGDRDNSRDVRGFRDRTREDYREKERAIEVVMETEAPRSPSRSRSFSGDRFSSRSPSPAAPIRTLPLTDSPARPRRPESPIKELIKVKEIIMEQPELPVPDIEPCLINESPDMHIFETMSPDVTGSLMEQGYMSDGEYEAISSEDEFIDIDTELGIDYEMDEEAFSYLTAPFNPYQFEMTPLLSYSNVALTHFELEKAKLLSSDYVKPEKCPKDAQLLIDIVEKFKSAEHFDSWVETLEGVPALLPKGLSYLMYKENNTDVLSKLIDWMIEGLNESQAMAQPESTYKVRHLKMGFKLAGALCSCDSTIAIQCLSRDVQNKLLDNLQSKFMSFSLKLHIIAALDQTTRLQDGIYWYLGSHKLQAVKQEVGIEPCLSCYQRTVQLLLQKQVIRVVVALTTLIKKIHLVEVMNKLGQHLESIVTAADMNTKVDGADTNEIYQMTRHISEIDIEAISTCIDEITKVYTLAPTFIAQPGRTLPGRNMVEIKSCPLDPYPGFYHMANCCHLLESLLFFLSSPITCNILTIFSGIRCLLRKMISYQHGLVYLGTRLEITNKIIQALVQVTDYNREEENVAQQLGIELIYCLQSLSITDKLLEYLQRPIKNPFEDQQPVTLLHMLYTMTFNPQGHTSVVQVLTYEDNIKAIIPFVQLTGNDKDDAKIRKSVCAGYAAELLNVVIHHSDNVSFLCRHKADLITLGESEFSHKLTRLKDWLTPVKKFTSFNHEGLPAIIEQLKLYADDIVKLPRGLITILRVLRHLAIAPTNEYPEDRNDELKYKYVLVELFSAECCPIFVTFLQKLSELMIRPWQQGIPRSREAFSLYLNNIQPIIEMLKAITQYLIMARGTEFADLTTLPVLFELHTVLCSVPASSLFVTKINYIQKEIIDTIAAYTQPLLQPSEERDKISQSLWTLAIRDLLKFTMKAPYTYLSGLQILSELLPLPLPLQTREPLTKEEEALALNTRKLLSAHLLPLHGALHNIIHSLSITSCQPLQQILRKICWQMSDLAAPTATMITQCILDILLEHIDVISSDVKAGQETVAQKIALATRGRILNLLASLLSQPAVKCTMLRIMGPSGEEKYQNILQKMLDILNCVTDREDHVQDQECILSILQSLCDWEVTLTSGETTLTIPEQVANALPSSSQLTIIIEALLEHIAHPSHKYHTVLPCIRALVMLTEQDYIFYLLKITFEKHKQAMYRLLQRIKFKFCKDSSDCLSTFSTTLEFLRLLVSTEPPVEDVSPTRTLTLSHHELRELVGWSKDFTNHPLVDLQKHVEEGVQEEETLYSLVEGVNNLIAILKRDSPQKPKQDISPPTLPQPYALAELFNLRSVCIVTNPDDEHLSPTFWQTTFEPDAPDLIPCDLDAMCIKYCRDLNLEEELKKDKGLGTDEELTKPKKLKDRRKSQEYVSWRGRGIRRPFVAPMRGRGIARGLAAQANRHDNFRSRAPNTSRPPSMHVDDFMKLEQKSEQNEEGAGDTESLMRRGEPFPDFMRGRGRGGFDCGRGFDRGRARFFTPPGSFRRDAGPGHDGDNLLYRSKPPFISSTPRFQRGNDRPMSGDRRDNGRGGRFEPRGRGTWRGGNWNERFGNNDVVFRGRSDPGRHQRSFTK